MDLEKKILSMKDYCDEEAIASALRITRETVHDVLSGKASIDRQVTDKENILQVTSTPVYRQRTISVWRGAGGVGCTTIALHLAYLLEGIMSVLLVDMGPGSAGSDIGYYLRQPEYPNMDTLKNGLTSAILQVEDRLWLLQPPQGEIDKQTVERLSLEAKKEFDAIIIDLPNSDADCVQEAVSCSNTLVMVTSGHAPDLNRVYARRSAKDTILVVNSYPCDTPTRRDFNNRVVEIPEEKGLKEKMERCEFLRRSPVTAGVEKIRDMLYGHGQDAGVKKVFKMILGR